jgi:hypothetical protein
MQLIELYCNRVKVGRFATTAETFLCCKTISFREKGEERISACGSTSHHLSARVHLRRTLAQAFVTNILFRIFTVGYKTESSLFF